MALIKCDDCSKEISDKSSVCIHCGCPVKKTDESVISTVSAPVYESNYLGCKISIYPKYIEYKILGQSKSLPINQVASVAYGLDFAVTIETTGGKKIKIPVSKKKEVKQTIYNLL